MFVVTEVKRRQQPFTVWRVCKGFPPRSYFFAASRDLAEAYVERAIISLRNRGQEP